MCLWQYSVIVTRLYYETSQLPQADKEAGAVVITEGSHLYLNWAFDSPNRDLSDVGENLSCFDIVCHSRGWSTRQLLHPFECFNWTNRKFPADSFDRDVPENVYTVGQHGHWQFEYLPPPQEQADIQNISGQLNTLNLSTSSCSRISTMWMLGAYCTLPIFRSFDTLTRLIVQQ